MNLQLRGDGGLLSAPLPHQRRSRSLEGRTSDTVMTLDLLNFKKGWMMKLDETEQWRKFWFVLSTDRLRFYRDSVAEETSDLEGEIDLTKCFSVSEYQVQRNYSFQIHTLMGVFTLSAMTAGIRRSWIQALMKNVHPASAPDVASLPGHHFPCSPPEVVPRPDVTQDSGPQDVPTETDLQSKSRSVTERRQEGTFDWSEVRPQNMENNRQEMQPLSPLELGDLERRQRREERRRRYENMLGFSLGQTDTQKTEDGSARTPSPKSRLQVEEEIEECWRKVEKAGFVPERKVLLGPETQGGFEVEKLYSYSKMVEDLKVQLDDSERRRLKLEAQIGAAGLYDEQVPVSERESREVYLQQQQQLITPHQEHLHLKSSSSAPQLPIIWLQDTEDNLQQLDSAGFSQQDTSQVDGLVLGLNFNGTSDHHLDRGDHQLFPTSESSRDFLVLEETAHDASDPSAMKTLSQEVDELTRQNQALDQQNQEMINQLMEADREIERLKTELCGKFSEPRLLLNLELKEKVIEDLERQLSLRNQELLDAQTLISSLLQLKAAPGTEPSGDESRKNSETSEGCLELTEVEKQLDESERTCRQLEQQKAELYLQRASEEESDLRKEENQKEEEQNRKITDEERIQQVMEGMVTRLKMLEKLLEVIDRLGLIRGAEEEESPDMVTQLKWEEEFWKLLLMELKDDPIGLLLREVTEGLMLEKRVLLEAHDLLLHSGEDLDLVLNGTKKPEPPAKPLGELEHLRVFTQIKISLLSQTSSSIRASAVHELLQTAGGLYDPVLLAHSAAAEALSCCWLTHLRSRCLGGLCCTSLQQENQEEHLSFGSKTSTWCQTDEIHLQGSEPQISAGQMHEEGENNGQMISEEHLGEREEESNMDVSDAGVKAMVLEDQLLMDRMKDEFQQKMSSVQKQHEEEVDRLKATCERGLSIMEECHLKVVEELQRLHQQEVEHLLVERDRLLEEESAATSTAIEAIQNAHHEELQREVQRRCQSGDGTPQMEEIHRQHREELASSQRELHVLSQQFSLKCLEIGHLVQALDSERKALCQCQQENQDLRSRNQELSGHLAAEITRLCSMAQQDTLPLSLGTDRYEMEITLRVKESEVQCLKQEITSLKDELQAALKDTRNATRRYKDALTELKVVRAKGEREADELRENLKLAHQALSPP